MNQSAPAWQLFENLVHRILEVNNFRVTTNDIRGDKGFDLLADFGNERWAIEVKYYRTTRAQPSLIDAAAVRVASNGVAARVQKGMLVFSCILPADLREALENKFSITFAAFSPSSVK